MGFNLGGEAVSLLFNAATFAKGVFDDSFGPNGGRDLIVAANGLDVLVVIDATLQETITKASDVSEFPVEEGKSITDHIRPRPTEVRLDGIVTDTTLDRSFLERAVRSSPFFGGLIADAGGAINNAGGGLVGLAVGAVLSLIQSTEMKRAQSAYQTLSLLHETGALVTIVTEREEFASMAMTELVITRDPQTGDALRFSATFREVITVSSRSAVITIPNQKKADLGHKQPSVSEDPLKQLATKKMSTAYEIIHGKDSK